ncbi:MAG: exosortase, partial [Acidobacteria bacterium]|nr:exosortase [Acidobacteriota bacterium]
SRLSFVLLLAGLAWTFWGRARLRTLVFPLLLLATMIPLPSIVYNALAVKLQLFASQVSSNLAQALGVTVFAEGNVIHLAGTTLGVAEACSGLRSLSSLTVMALLLGFLQCQLVRTRVGLVLMALPIAISVNVLRVTGTALLSDYDQDLAMGFYHTFESWLVFLVGMVLVMAASKGLRLLFERKAHG